MRKTMPVTDLTKTDAENIQAILQYILENGAIHKDLVPEALGHIQPPQYARYRNLILELDPAVVEYDPQSNNQGLPATEHLEIYMEHGGFLHFFNAELARMQQTASSRLQTDAQQRAANAGKAAGSRATIAMILAIIALVIEILIILFK
ncbi:hypothetical protein [Niabella aurantiaca]|uniref:hypothetical protein n=1 Tax=Niabella aurantiaca TaxID=379900 RepID=UPI00036028BB|nr:hypothetical protein [Niabella aurantiaca]